MANLGYVSTFNINGSELSLKDAALTEVVEEIVEAIGANNGDISERINNLHERSFDALIKISSQAETEIANIQDGMYKLQYVTITGEGDNATETLNNSAILIQKGTNQYLYKDGQISSRTKTNNTWGSWTTFEGGVTSVNGQTGAVTLSIPDDSNLVHKTGNETINGNKTFNDDIIISNTNFHNITGKYIEGPDFSWIKHQYGKNYNTIYTLQQALDARNNLVTSVNGMTGAVSITIPDVPVTSVNGMTGAVTITETQLSKGTETGTGNAVTDINVSNHEITLVKGATYATPTDVQNAVATGVANLVNSAPETLDTLNELATALGNDPNFATTIANQIGQKYTKPNDGIPASDLADGVIPNVPVTSVNGMTGAVVLPESGVTSFNGATGAITYTAPVTSVNGMTGAVVIENELSVNYEMASNSNGELVLEAGDTYEEAFGKIEKAINDNEIIIAASLNDLDSKINNIPTYDSSHKLSADLIEDGTTNKVINVKPDWNATSGSSTEILNKPDLSNFLTTETQANWNETNTSSAAYIQNKPAIVNSVNGMTGAVTINIPDVPVTSVNGMTGAITLSIPDAQIQADWNQTATGAKDYIKNKPKIINLDTGSNKVFGTKINGIVGECITLMGTTTISNDNGKATIELGYSASDDTTIKLTSLGSDGGVYVSTNIQKFYYNNKEVAVKDDIKVTSVNGMTGAVIINIPDVPVTSVNGMTGAITLSIPDAQIQADWNQTATGAKDYIKNKPDLSNFLTIETQPNWNETNTSSAAYIQNKPTIPDAQIQSDWNQTATGAKDYIKNKPNITVISNPNNDSNISPNGSLDIRPNLLTGDINITTSFDMGDVNITGGEELNLYSGDSDININSGSSLNLIANYKVYYNGKEVATKNDIPTVPTTSTTVTQNDTNPVSGGAVYAKFADLIGTAPAALDTLGEIAAALNNDANLAATLTNQISSKVPKVSNPTADNFASFNSDGTIKDSGHSHSDYITSIKTVNNESLVGSGNVVISGLPQVSASDNGKILMVVNGQWTLVSPSTLYSGNGVPNNSNGNNGDLYMQTD